VPSVEIVVSELVGQLVDVDPDCWIANSESLNVEELKKEKIGLVYESLDESSTARVKVIQTRPLSREALLMWLDETENSGLSLEEGTDSLTFAAALFDSLRGPKAKDAKRRIVLPMSPSLAVLQDARGLSGRENPPNTATIVEQIYRLGAENLGEGSLAIEKLWFAMHQLLRDDHLLRSIDESVRRGVLPREIAESLKSVDENQFEKLELFIRRSVPDPIDFPFNPFRWFHTSWNRLMSPEWTSAMSSRRWLAWATSLIRTGVGFAYLWEARWYEAVAREVIWLSEDPSRTPPDHRQLMAEIEKNPTVSWLESSRGTSARDISGRLKKLVYRGNGVAGKLGSYFKSLESRDRALLGFSFIDGMKILSEDQKLVEEIRGIWDGREPDRSKNTWELVRYLLMSRSNDDEQSRGEAAEQRDFYGLFRKSGTRYLIVEPSTEWVAVLASLTRKSPNDSATLSDVLEDLRRLGLRPSVETVTTCLELTGLARSAPDADIGIMVASAFGGGT
jgi:hypothetical protein